MTGLTNGTSYTFRVVATSQGGPSSPSVATSSVVPAGQALPPTSVSVKAGDRRATVRWSSGDANGSPITGYLLTRMPGGHVTQVNATKVKKVVTGLKNGRDYVFAVAAVNAVGISDATESETVRPAGTPDRVKQVTAQSRHGAARVSWTTPSDNGASLLKYQVETKSGKRRTVDSSTLQLRFDRLQSGSKQRFRVRAINEVGRGPWSKWTPKVRIG